ncbi:type I-D CRISPR-associated endonuclease Cas1d [Methanospirillum purgamenti]|uniref:CRISPR-associated endonuclease Cas1 n=1 Tax=Methanospirillum hungatei TaxID=2203 RepID=A0A8F5VJL7_METHU|nr:type I-D CRISPR-associated endonuclease Cas1d [Methanospirillum hungatei]QXO94217.1 type I-D CRISPR-associated endonuclease Cas1d [Methanospirillum hungatei]
MNQDNEIPMVNTSEPVRDPKPPEGLLEDDTIYITTPYGKVSLDGGRIRVKDSDGKDIASFPLEKVCTINIFGSASVSTPLLKHCSDKEVTINYFTVFGKYFGSFVPARNTISLVRRHQAKITSEESLVICREIIHAKLQNSCVFLSRKKVEVPYLLKELRDKSIHAVSVDSLRGVEGEAASLYFQLFSSSLPEEWRSDKRTRRPPKDELNALLSLTYTMVTSEVISALRQFNLDPFIGIMHVDRHGKPALALDLIEEFRPVFCDAFVARLINKRMITKDEFTQESHLNDVSFKKYLGFYHEFMEETLKHPRFKYPVSRKKIIQIQAILLRKAICGELNGYYPFLYTR